MQVFIDYSLEKNAINKIEMQDAFWVAAVSNGFTKLLQMLIYWQIKLKNVTNWDELEKANIVNIDIIDQWFASCYQVSEVGTNSNEQIKFYLKSLKTICFDSGFKNFELLMTFLDWKGLNSNLNRKQIDEKLLQFSKLMNVVTNIIDYSRKYDYGNKCLVQISQSIINMVKNKEPVDDTLLLLAARMIPDKFDATLIKSVTESISKDSDIKHKAIAAAWFKTIILNSNVLSLILRDDNTVDEQKDETEATQFKSNHNYKLLFEKIEKESIESELVKQQNFIKSEIIKMSEKDPKGWEGLLNYREYLVTVGGKLSQTSFTYDIKGKFTSEQPWPPTFKETELVTDYVTGFNGASEYDNVCFVFY